MRILYSKSAEKALKCMEEKLRNRIREAIRGLTQIPPVGDIKPLQGAPAGCYRLRVGGYRVIYRYGNDGDCVVLLILDIGSRGDIYK